MTVLASLLLGATVGLANALAAAWTARRAVGRSSEQTLRLVLGGMAARMAATLAAVGLVLAFVEVHRGAFVAGLGVLFALGLLVEVAIVSGRLGGRAPHPSPADA